MNRSRVPASLAAVVSVLGATLVTTASAPASADSRRALDISAFSDLLVDEAHGRLLLSQGPGTSEVAVTDLKGAPVTQLTGLPGAADMVLSHDGATIYIGLADGDAIAAYDAATLDAVAVYPTGQDSCPASLAAVGSMVAFEALCDNTSGSVLGVLDPADGTVSDEGPGYAGELYSNAAQPNTVYRLFSPSGDGVVAKLTLTTSEPADRLQEVDRAATPRAYRLAGSSDGSLLVTERGKVYETAGLTLAASVPVSGGVANPAGVGVAVNVDGVVALTQRGHEGSDLFLHQQAASAPLTYAPMRGYELDGAAELSKQHVAAYGGLAFGTRDAYVLSERSLASGSEFRLNVVTPSSGDAALTVDVPDQILAPGSPAPVSAQLALPGDASVAGRQISFEVAPVGSPFHLAATVDTDAEGRATTSLRLDQNARVRVRYVDAETTTDVDAYANIRVSATIRASVIGSKVRRGKYVVFPVSRRATLRAFSTNSNSCLLFEVQRSRNGSWAPATTFPCATPAAPLSGPRGVTQYVAGQRRAGHLLRARATSRRTDYVSAGTSDWVYFTFTR